MKKLLMIAFAAASLVACSNYLDEFKDEYENSFVSVDDPENVSSDSHGQTPGDGSKLSSAQTDASSSNAWTEGQSSGKTDEEYDCYMNDSACISEIANEFGKTVRLLDSRNNNVYTAIYVGGYDYETANGYGSIFNDSVSFLLMTENLEYEGDSVTALDTNGVFFYTYENAEKACPTGWRLPKITPEWFFLLTGDGNHFNIELPDNEKGCYINGKFDSGKSIFYWAQKEGETSWFVNKGLYANDYVLHEYERCNTFPVRCVKEFGRHADYAGSSSSSGETKSSSSEGGSSSITTCGDFFDENALSLDSVLDSVGSNIPEAFSSGWINVNRYCLDDSYNFKVTDKTQFCVEYTDDSKNAAFFYGYQAGETSGEYNHVILTSPVFNADTSCSEGCQINCFEIPKGEKIKSLYVKGHEAVANSSSSSVNPVSSAKSSSSSAKSSSSCTDVFDENCSVTDAAKILNGYSSSSISGSMLFDANENYKMKNDSAINVEGFKQNFADGWMKVVGYLRSSPYISFNTDPGLENEVGALPVDISAWGGICMTYASNVSINVVAHDPRIEGGNVEYVTMSSKFDATNGNQAEFVCVDWGDNATSLTNIDQIRLVPVSSSSSDPAVIYIKNISTKKKTDVTISTSDKNCGGENRKYCKELGDEQIDLSLFESYTVTGVTCNDFDLLVTANSESYYICGKDSPQTVEIDNAQVGTSDCGDLNLKYANLINPVLEGFSFVCLGQPSVTFHPKSWYAAPVPSSTSN